MEFMAAVLTKGLTDFSAEECAHFCSVYEHWFKKSEFVTIDSIIDSLHKGFKMQWSIECWPSREALAVQLKSKKFDISRL